MTATFVLWLFLQNGQVLAVPGFRSQVNCQEVGDWYQREAQRGQSLQFKCGPGPDVAAIQLPFAFGRR